MRSSGTFCCNPIVEWLGGGVSSRMTGCKNFYTQVEQVAGSPGDADQCVKDTTGCGLVVVVVELR